MTHKKLLLESTYLEMLCRKIKIRYMYRNNFHFRVFVKNLSKYITLQYYWNVFLQYNKKRTS